MTLDIPVDAKINSPADVNYRTVSASWILDKMQEAGSKANIVILDACRNNPFTRGFRGKTRGLAAMQPAKGAYILYATSPGKEAADGKSRNGIFTKHLLMQINTPGLPLELLAKNVAVGVEAETNGSQTPWSEGMLLGQFTFNTAGGDVAIAVQPQNTIPALDPEEEAWRLAKDSISSEDIKMFIKSWPSGRFSTAAKLKLAKLERSQNTNTQEDTTQREEMLRQLEELKKKDEDRKLADQEERTRIKQAQLNTVDGKKPQLTEISTNHEQNKKSTASVTTKYSQSKKNHTDPTTGMEFVLVPGGCFQMGDTFGKGTSDDKPVHEVCVDGFFMGKYEVTQGEYTKIKGSNPSYSNKGDRFPVEQISWDDAQSFIRSLNSKSGKSYRLPTEAEWEYAARSGGKNEKYAGDDSPERVAWYNSNSGSSSHQVGTKSPNGLGLYDMTGNVWEWCQDWYDADYYRSSPRDKPLGPRSGSYHVLRGGGWGYGSLDVRTALRYRNTPSYRFLNLGFRLLLPVQ